MLVFACTLFIFAGYLLWDDSILFEKHEISGVDAVGEVSLAKNDVRRKTKQEFSWSTLPTESPLYSGDSLFTGKDSQLLLKLNDGTEMTISENTLIVLEKSTSSLNLDLKYGEVDKIENSASKIILTQAGERSEVQGSKESILSIKSIKGSAAVVKVVSGEVKIKKKTGESKTIVAGKSEKIDPIKPKQVLPPRLEQPASNSVFLLDRKTLINPNGEINKRNKFSWQKHSEESVLLQLARDKDFKQIIFKQELTDSEFIFPNFKDAGKYFWRVGSISAVSRSVLNSDTHILNVMPTLQVAELSPSHQMTRWDFKSELRQKFSWTPNRLFQSYKIEISKGSEFLDLLVSEELKTESFEWKSIKEFGTYYWRLTASTGKGESSYSVTTEPHEFTILENKSPVALFPPAETTLIVKGRKLLLPGESLELAETKPEAEFFTFKWDKSNFAKVVFEISPTPEFKDIRFSQSTLDSEIKISNLPAQEGYWRVRGEDERHSKSLASTPIKLKVLSEIIKTEVSAPTISKADKQIEMRPRGNRLPSAIDRDWYKPFDLSGQNRPFIEWEKIPGAKKYNVAIAKDRSFKFVVQTASVEENIYRWPEMKPGFYYWSVNATESALSKEGAKAYGTVQIFVPPPLLDQVNLKKEKVLTEKEMAAAMPRVKLKWRPSPLAKSYRVEIAKDQKFTNPQKFKSHNESLSHAIKENGDYFWHVTALDSEDKEISVFSEPSKFSFERTYGLYTPAALNPKFDSSMVFMSKKASHVVLGWQKIKGAAKYEFELSQDSDFKKPYYKGSSSALKEYLPIELPSGKNYWRVRAVNEKYQSDWVEPSPFVVSYGK